MKNIFSEYINIVGYLVTGVVFFVCVSIMFNNIFTEYICINKDSNYIWEQIGSLTTDVNLDNYVTKVEFNTLKSTVLTAQDVTTSSGIAVTVNYDIPSTLYDE